MTAPAAWIREAYERAENLAATGLRIVIVPSSWGVSMWAEGADVDMISRSWAALDAANINPLIPSIETLATRARRKS